MTFRLTKTQAKELAGHKQKLSDAREKVIVEFEAMRESLSAATDKVNDEIRVYNDALEAARSFAESIAEEHRDAYDDRSEKWQDGDVGQSALAFVEAWECYAPDEVGEVEIVEPDLPDFGDEGIDDLPEEADA